MKHQLLVLAVLVAWTTGCDDKKSGSADTGTEPMEDPIDDEAGDVDADDVLDAVDVSDGDDASDADLDAEVDGIEPAPGWEVPVLLETEETLGAVAPQVVADGEGNAVAVWIQGTALAGRVWTSSYSTATGWGTARRLDIASGMVNGYPSLEGNDSGVAVAVWSQVNGSSMEVWSCRYHSSTGWETPEVISTHVSTDITMPMVAVDDSGDAAASWVVQEGADLGIWGNVHDVAGGWGTAQRLDNISATPIIQDIEGDGSGGFVVLWSTLYGDAYNWWSRFEPSTGWTTAETFGTTSTEDLASRCGFDAGGAMLVVWVEMPMSDAATFRWSRWDASSGWTADETIDIPDMGFVPVYSPMELEVEGSGNATLVWHQGALDGPVNYLVRSSLYDVSTGWGAPVLVGSDPGSGSPVDVTLDGDGDGNAVAAWIDRVASPVNRMDVMSSRLDASEGWGVHGPVENEDVYNCHSVSVSLGGDGRVVAVWLLVDGPFEHVMATHSL